MSASTLLRTTCWLLALGSAACGGPQAAAAEGQACFRDADCQEGLVCVEGRCSADVQSLVPIMQASQASTSTVNTSSAATGAGGTSGGSTVGTTSSTTGSTAGAAGAG